MKHLDHSTQISTLGLFQESYLKNHMEPLSSFLRRLKAKNYDLTPEAKSQTPNPHCFQWLNYKVHRNSWEETDRYSCHSIKGNRVKLPGHLLDPLPKQSDGITPGPPHSHLGALPPFLQKLLPAPGSHFPWHRFPRDTSILTKALKGRIVIHASSNQQHLAQCLARGWHSNAC